jgi:aspartate kinase
MHFDDAAELAYFGSRMLHPSTLLPARQGRVPVRVLNTNRPEHPGTVIDDHAATADGLTSIAYKENQIALELRSTRMFGQAGFLAQVFDIVGRHGLVVDVVATSEVSISMTITDGPALERALPELHTLGECRVLRGKTLLVVVGRSLSARAGMAAEILATVARTGANVEMISYGLHSINFSIIIDNSDIGRVVPVLHEMLMERESRGGAH